ncbi:MAG: DUF4331 domain-containing protein [Chloroflexota bacterium]|nr:DUF4331 domain-containing protein [Chloroflexota bacterium]
MSSHREAPEISKDPVADNTDTYAFRDPNDPSMVTFLANYIPLEGPDGGPNFFEFGSDVLYSIHIDNVGDGKDHITYDFRFSTSIVDTNSFLYNTGQIFNITDKTWNRPQSYSVTRTDSTGTHSLGSGLLCPPCNVGARSTPNYTTLADQAVHALPSGETVFAGQRREGFYLDLGTIFDLLALRPFQSLHRFPPKTDQPGVDTTKFVNVHTIALKVPIARLTRDGSTPTSVSDPRATIGMYAAASRQKVRIFASQSKGSKQEDNGNNGNQGDNNRTSEMQESGPFVQVSRLGNPLFNELLVQMPEKDYWNQSAPEDDSQFLPRVLWPEVQVLLVRLYPGVFPHLATVTGPTAGSPNGGFKDRNDLKAILLTGLPPNLVPGFQNYTGPVLADMLRLNVAIPPVPIGTENVYGVLGGDLAGYPNGRRVHDDVTTITVRALAGLSYKLVEPTYTPDAAAGVAFDVTPPTYSDRFHATFPYLGLPHSGYDVPTAGQQAELAPAPA